MLPGRRPLWALAYTVGASLAIASCATSQAPAAASPTPPSPATASPTMTPSPAPPDGGAPAATPSPEGPNRLRETPVEPGSPRGQPGNYSAQFQSGGRLRTYLLHVPPAVNEGRPLPLVVALHGGGGTGRQTDGLMLLTPVADREGFLVVFPDGVGRIWNDGRTDVRSRATNEMVDDVGFLTAVVDEVAKVVRVDPRRTYATGISNGAMMAGRLACEAADRFAAVGLVAGTGPANLEQWCAPRRPVPIIDFHGTDDPLVPYGGGPIRGLLPGLTRGAVIGVDGLKALWLRNNRSSPTPDEARLPASPGFGITRQAYRSADGADVVFYRIEGGGHTRPGGRQYLPESLVGRTNRDINASEIIWKFFAAHPMPSG